MLIRRTITILFGLTFLLAGVACGKSVQPAADDETPDAGNQAEVVAPAENGDAEILRISGEGNSVSTPFQLDGSGAIKVYWRQECGYFSLMMVNTNQALAESPMGTVAFESTTIPNEFVEDYPEYIPFEYLPGEYTMQVTCEDGSWEVWAVVEYPGGQ